MVQDHALNRKKTNCYDTVLHSNRLCTFIPERFVSLPYLHLLSLPMRVIARRVLRVTLGKKPFNKIHLQKCQSYSTLHSTPAFMRYMAVGLRALGGDTQKARTLLNRKRALEEGIPPHPRGHVWVGSHSASIIDLKNHLWSLASSVKKAAKYQVNKTLNRCQVFYKR